MSGRRLLRKAQRNDGQAAVELAIILPILVLLVFGALEFGRVFNAWIIVTQASRDGARVASVRCPQDAGCSSAVQTRVNSSLSGLDLADSRMTVSGGPYTSGDAVSVRVEHDVNLVVPLISAFFSGGDVTVVGDTTMRLE